MYKRTHLFSLAYFSFFLVFVSTGSYAQTHNWESGYPNLRQEAAGFGMKVNMDLQSNAYYVVYDVDPSCYQGT